jgi:Putative beta-barrel porin-2, OmpL-like. bbp2
MRRDRIARFLPSVLAIAIGIVVTSSSRAQDDVGGYDAPSLSMLLPPSVAQNLDLDAWGWLSYAPAIPHNRENYWDLDLALGATQRLGDRLAATADIHFLDSNGSPRGQLQQAFVTAELSEKSGMLLTVGKFNSPFGVEPRNAWDRVGGTTSLLFGAEPQDLLGVMLTQPLGDTRITARPFVVTDFQGRSNLEGPPSPGLMLECRPTHDLTFALTNWIGPGVTHEEEYAYTEADDEYASPSSFSMSRKSLVRISLAVTFTAIALRAAASDAPATQPFAALDRPATQPAGYALQPDSNCRRLGFAASRPLAGGRLHRVRAGAGCPAAAG